MYTIMTQVAADELGLSREFSRRKTGRYRVPARPSGCRFDEHRQRNARRQGRPPPTRGSSSLISLYPIPNRRCTAPVPPTWFSRTAEFRESRLPIAPKVFTAVIGGTAANPIEGTAQTSLPGDWDQYARHSFGAVFAEVSVDPDLGMVRVPRIVAVFDVGKVLNAKTAKSQFIGGIVWGISLALHEDTYLDLRSGRIANANLAGLSRSRKRRYR